MNDFATHARAMQAVQDRLGDDCPIAIWDNQDWKLIPGTAQRRKDLASGGYQQNADLRFEALVSTFPDASIKDAQSLKDYILQEAIGYLGDDYKVMSVGIRPGGLQVIVECNSMNQGA